MWQLINWGTWMFASSLLLALPALTALLIVNFSFGVMSRAAPQLNIFSLGFPISLITGLFLLWLSSTTLSPHYENLVSQTFEKMNILISP
jgi:flagellar biosynthetic protein FliR